METREIEVLLTRGIDGWWVVTVPALVGVVTQGRTKPEALANAREAIELFLEEASPDEIDGSRYELTTVRVAG